MGRPRRIACRMSCLAVSCRLHLLNSVFCTTTSHTESASVLHTLATRHRRVSLDHSGLPVQDLSFRVGFAAPAGRYCKRSLQVTSAGLLPATSLLLPGDVDVSVQPHRSAMMSLTFVALSNSDKLDVWLASLDDLNEFFDGRSAGDHPSNCCSHD